MPVKVVDAIMGTGKSSAAITYMNEHPNQRFVYITPYLTEVARIKKSCPKLKFIEPSNKLNKSNFKKTLHAEFLIKEGRNIITTAQVFKNYNKEILKTIKEQEYVLILDEHVDTVGTVDLDPFDGKMLVEAKRFNDNDGVLTLTEKAWLYDGNVFAEPINLMKSREMFRIGAYEEDAKFLYWTLPPDFISSFKDVFILTYLFEGQSLCNFLKIYNIPYEYIGVKKSSDSIYRFSFCCDCMQEYTHNLKSRIHVVDNKKLNSVGDNYYALSMNWFKNNKIEVEQLRKNISNWFKNICEEVKSDKRLCGTYVASFQKIKGDGYTKAIIPFNMRATNEYRDKTHLVYAANPFIDEGEKQLFKRQGIELNEDMYALSIMVQWIWRSAIRDGKEIYIYIPSRRMRTIFEDWIETI